MDEYLSEKEQLERLKAWLRENGAWIVIGVALGALAVGGWRWWQSRTESVALDASARYQQLLVTFGRGDTAQALASVDQLVKDHAGSPYADQAQLAAARVMVENGQLDRSAAYLTAVVQRTKDPELAIVARLRLARVQLAQNKADEALATLGTADQGAFQARFAEVRGDAYFAKGDRAAALREYQAARTAAGPSVAANATLDLKINDLTDGAPTAPATTPTSQPAANKVN